MARIQQSSAPNLPSDGKLGFRSGLLLNWRDNPNIVPFRQFTINAIQMHLAQKTSGDLRTAVPQLALIMEDQIFRDAVSQEDYMDQEKLFDRVGALIVQKWYDQQKAMQKTNLLTMYTSAPPAVQTTRRDFGTSFNSNLRDKPMSADIGINMGCPDNMSRQYLSATAVKTGFHGSRKRSFDATLQHSEWMLSKVCSPREGFTCGDPVDSSGPTFSGSVLQYDSEASFESHRSNSQFQSEGDLNIIMSSNQSSPSVQTPSIIGESYDGCLGKPISFAGVLCQNKNSYAVQDAMARPLPLSSYHGFSQHSFDDVQRRSIDKLLSTYILYNKNCFERKIPFLEFWHSRNCGGGICSCENNKMVLSHFDTCGSSDCAVCAPAVRTHGTEAGNTVCYKVSEDLMIPTKYRKLDASSMRCGSSYDVDSIGLSGRLNVDPENPVMATSDSPEATMEMACHADDPIRSGQAGNSVVDVVLKSNSDDVSGPGEVMTAVKPESPHESKDMGSDGFSKLLPDPAPSLCEELKTFQGQEVITTNDPEIVEPKEEESSSSVATLTVQGQEVITKIDPELLEPKEEVSSSSVATLTEMKVEKQKVDGISLIDFFTEEEIRQHMSGLRKKVDQVIADETVGNTATCSVSENFCQLCAQDRLSFPPMPIFCSACAARVKNYQSYYSTKDDRAQFCFCSHCYHRSRLNITFLGFSIAKNILELRKNNLVTEESWVQCDKCEGWQHQICALFNDKRDLGGKVEYICPKCHLEDLATAEGRISRTTSFDASNLPRTLLSNHLEERLVRRLNEEREERAKATGKNPEEVPQPADLVVRVVSSVDKMLKVKQQFLDIFPEKNYPAEFPYRSKVILLFQRIEGVDVCLFAMYVQEYGSECSLPNQRCVYISYLDSVKYFRPDDKTLKGEALRTFVYHEILVGYLDYCKKRGFVTCYIWACPPVKGEDYILYCHPETQKTPRPDKLRQWYQTMLKKATEQKIVVSFSNLYEKFFVPNGESNTKVTAARLPYLEGDYWSSIVESIIKKIEAESGGDLEKQIKKMTRRSLKAMGHTNPSAREAKDILLMQALAQSISSAKEDFIIVYLQSVCTQCHEVMLSGKRWSCNQCKNYEICERCHDKEEYSGEGATHVSSSGQKHTLHQDMVEDVAIDTEDNDAIMSNCFLENRHSFLNFCQGNHYQFDSLRRAKHSSMMILYHLHNPNESGIGASCSLCLKYIGADPKWTCEMCPDFCVCSTCHQRNNFSCHVHTLIRDPPFATAGHKVAEMVRELLNVVLHASRCQTIPGYSCSFPRCTLLRRLFSHAQACSIRARGGCQYCKKIWFVLVLHSRRCKDSNCPVPRCRDLKEHALRLKTKSETKPFKQLPDASRQPIL